jgi:AmmeMemoRadiSam system protein A
MELSIRDKRDLLMMVRNHLKHKLQGAPAVDIPREMKLFDESPGIFVTYHKNGDLRGCIGYIVGFKALRESFFEIVEAAAFRDPRFPALKAEELAEIDIEISLLTPPQPIEEWKKIVPGQHGVILSDGYHQATFLPQVASEQGWSLEEMLSSLALKAGLRANDYKSSAVKYEVYTALVFNEKEFGLSRQ